MSGYRKIRDQSLLTNLKGVLHNILGQERSHLLLTPFTGQRKEPFCICAVGIGTWETQPGPKLQAGQTHTTWQRVSDEEPEWWGEKQMGLHRIMQVMETHPAPPLLEPSSLGETCLARNLKGSGGSDWVWRLNSREKETQVSGWWRGQRIGALATQGEPKGDSWGSVPHHGLATAGTCIHWFKIFRSITIQLRTQSLPQPKYHFQDLCFQDFLSHTSDPTLCVEQTSHSSPPTQDCWEGKTRIFWTPMETAFFRFSIKSLKEIF